MVLSDDVEKMLTIKLFSEKTGLPPSTLRFYDSKKLLIPQQRLENGYRAYSESQIADALMIHSLRNADIEIDEIRKYLSSDDIEKSNLIIKWREEVRSKLSALKVAEQYLGGLTPQERHIHLIRWDESVRFIWREYTVTRKQKPFHDAAIKEREQLLEKGFTLAPGFYVRQLYSKGKQMTGEIGFLIKDISLDDIEKNGWYIEKWDPTLFACMECEVDNEFLCFQFIQMIRQYGFVPSGNKLEKYEDNDSGLFQYLIPLKKEHI